MASKSFEYSVRIKASLDSSKLNGAGSRVSRQIDDELGKGAVGRSTKYTRDLTRELASLERQSVTLGKSFNRLGNTAELSKVRALFADIQKINKAGVAGNGGMVADLQRQFSRSYNRSLPTSEKTPRDHSAVHSTQALPDFSAGSQAVWSRLSHRLSSRSSGF